MKGFFDIFHKWSNYLHGTVPFANIEMLFSTGDPDIQSITGTGGIIVTSIKDGEVVSQSLLNPYQKSISILSDPDTPITIKGKVIELSMGNNPTLQKLSVSGTSLISLNSSYCFGLQELDLSECTSLTSLECISCQSLQVLDLSTNTELVSLNCAFCYSLQELDLSNNTKLALLEYWGIFRIKTIKYRAINQATATGIGSAIANALSIGTVYLNTSDPYYSTVADAATYKGWTIEPLS